MEETIQHLSRLWPYLLRHRRAFFLGAIALLTTDILALAAPWVLRAAIDELSLGMEHRRLVQYTAAIIGITALAGVGRFFMRRLMIGASRRIEYDLRNDFFAHLTKLSPAFYLKNSTGDLMALATNDLNAVRNFVGPGIMQGANTSVTLITSLILMFVISPKLTLIAMIPMPMISLVMGRFGGIIHKRFEAVQEKFAEITARSQEYLAGVRVVKAYAQEANAISDFERRNREFVEENMSLVRVWGLFYPSMAFLAGTAGALVLYVGGLQVMQGQITLGDFVAFNTYLVMLVWPMIALGWVVNLFQRGAASMARINRIMDERPSILERPDAVPLDGVTGEIRFENVSFEYPNRPGTLALSGINLTIPAGGTVAVVGRTGSGKSSLMALIPRLFDPTEGRVLLDGRDLREYRLGGLRRQIGTVPQETFLFSRTIAENISLGVKEATERQIQEMAGIVRLSTDVEEFPDRYETLVGERGVTLSGGQKQRTAIARAILRSPMILILDDALSAVDTKTEEEILSGLNSVMKARTTLLVSHRVSTVRNADTIVVLDEGRIIEQGSHGELLAAGGAYAELDRLQKLKEELDSTA